MIPTHGELKDQAIEVHKEHGSTWNDGGTWFTWVYQLGDQFWEVHQPTDYRPEVEVYEVERKETVVVTYDKKEPET